jgi:hypothetical protein
MNENFSAQNNEIETAESLLAGHEYVDSYLEGEGDITIESIENKGLFAILDVRKEEGKPKMFVQFGLDSEKGAKSDQFMEPLEVTLPRDIDEEGIDVLRVLAMRLILRELEVPAADVSFKSAASRIKLALDKKEAS